MESDEAKDFIEKVTDLKEADVLSTVTAKLRQGDDPLVIIDTCQEGMLEVGKRYEKGEY